MSKEATAGRITEVEKSAKGVLEFVSRVIGEDVEGECLWIVGRDGLDA